MRHVLECAALGEVRTSDVVKTVADRLNLSQEDREELLPSGKQSRFANRISWAKGYLKQAGLVQYTKRGHFIITERGKAALADTDAEINKAYLERFEEFKAFQARTKKPAEILTHLLPLIRKARLHRMKYCVRPIRQLTPPSQRTYWTGCMKRRLSSLNV